ncbi:GMC oxidoreductase [Streptomyces sp. NPDC007164]|uniref:GMC family oxidoreductase n=1 Tax=Streptomyces sp. NPDC007164 TaxID=3156918 RepID=UPI0033F0CBA4
MPLVPDMNGPDNTGCSPATVTQQNGRRWSCADGYLREAVRRPSLTVFPNTLTQRITLSNGRATGVVCSTRQGRRQQLTARRDVILSAGAIGSPQLLMLSGIGDPDHLDDMRIAPQARLPGVGQGLQDHLSVPLIVRCPQPVTLINARSLRALATYVLRRRGPLTSNIGQAAGFTHTAPGLPGPDVELIFLLVPVVTDGRRLPTEHGFTISAVLLQPNSRGCILLRRRDPAAPPKIDPRYLTDRAGEDLNTLVRGVRKAQALLESSALAPYTGAPWFPELSTTDESSVARHIRRTAETTHHPVGTCRMGTGDEAVVDSQLRVHGIDGLRIVDASVMPRIPRGHTHAPTVMIAERAADLIRAGSQTPRAPA